MSVCAYVYVCVHVYMCVHICVCVCMCVCVCNGTYDDSDIADVML